jgi:predicted Zn-dependent peptidase
VSQNSLGFSSSFVVTVTLRSGADMAEVKRVIAAEIDRMRKEPITDRELKRAVAAFESGAVYGLESLLARVEQLQSYNHFLGKPDSITYDLDRYRRATADKVRDYCAQYLVDDRRVTVITNPADGGKP